MKYRITLSYDGAPFCGWQVQPDAPSVQGALERALETLLKCRTAVTGAGRTDTGVNARGYVAHFETESMVECNQLCFKLNAILPDAISVESVEPADKGFHARFDAKKRVYKYFLHRVKDPFIGRFSYEYGYPQLDVEAMNRAAASMLGTHDFSCFEKTGGDNRTSICTVAEASWTEYKPVIAASDKPGSYLCFTIAADRFLRNMVRATVGTLLEVGRGKRTEEEFKALIPDADERSETEITESGTMMPSTPECSCGIITGKVKTPERAPAGTPHPSRRSLAGESVPGHALFLTKIEY